MTGPAERLFIGIDPGLSGAVAILDQGGGLVLLDDLPTVASGSGKAKVGRRVDPAGLSQLLAPFRDRAALAVLEAVAARPGQGVASVFSLGDTFGAVRAVLACMGLSVALVSPTEWKRHYRLDGDKERSRARSIELFPDADLHRKADHNRAEALLLALFARQRDGPGAPATLHHQTDQYEYRNRQEQKL
jgi:crossover junction endodeoxyribonuclease RuvC